MMARWSYTGKLFREFVGFAKAKRVYWIVPLIIVLGIASVLIVGSNAIAPLLYTLF